MINLYRISGMLPVNKKMKIPLKNKIYYIGGHLSQKEVALDYWWG